MSDIFISYASEDREQAKALAHALESEGWSVWWDRMIPFGRPFDEVIQENINAARCVLVLWTASSVASKWVRSEASEAEERNVLIPIMLDRDVDIPLAFKLLQAANLTDWQPGVTHHEYTKLVEQITALIAGGTVPAGVRARASESFGTRSTTERTQTARSWGALTAIGLPSAMAVGIALGLMVWRTPTRIELALHADRLAFTVGGGERVAVLDRGTVFESLTVENLSRVAFSGTELRQLTPDGGLPVERGAVTLEGRPEARSSVTIEKDGEGGAAGRLEAIDAEPGAAVVLEVRGDGSRSTLRLGIDGQELAPNIWPLGSFQLTATQARMVAPVDGTAVLPGVTIRGVTSEAEPFIRVNGAPSSFSAVITPPAGATVELLGRAGTPITQLDLTRQSRAGFESALRSNATLTFPGYSKPAVVLDARTLIGIDGLRDALLSQTRVLSGQPGMEVTLTGTVGKLQSRLGSGPLLDHRLTLFEQLWYGARSAVLFSILVLVVTVSIGGYKVYKRVRK